MKISRFLALPVLVVVTLGIAPLAFAQYGDSPGRSNINRTPPEKTSAETTSQYVDDATITTKVKAALFEDAQLKSLQISVETDKGTVHLSGTVDTKTQSTTAEKVANDVNGVKSVQNDLKVKGT